MIEGVNPHLESSRITVGMIIPNALGYFNSLHGVQTRARNFTEPFALPPHCRGTRQVLGECWYRGREW